VSAVDGVAGRLAIAPAHPAASSAMITIAGARGILLRTSIARGRAGQCHRAIEPAPFGTVGAMSSRTA
jgi:hypothetical protein